MQSILLRDVNRSPSLETGVTASAAGERPSFLRRVGPGVAGFLFTGVSSLAIDAALRAAGIFPALDVPMTAGLFALATAYRAVLTVLGCALAARLAFDRPMRSALGLGLVGFVLSLVGVAVALSKPELGPLWYPIALAVTTLPCAWLGGKLGSQR